MMIYYQQYMHVHTLLSAQLQHEDKNNTAVQLTDILAVYPHYNAYKQRGPQNHPIMLLYK